MSPNQIELIENSWKFIVQNRSESGTIFYTRLFQINPELRSLFKEDIESQAQKLVALITFIVHKLNNIDDVLADVKALGERHRKYNVKPEYYGSVANALLWTLEKALGDRWTKEMEDAWVAMYLMLSRTMIEAARSQEIII